MSHNFIVTFPLVIFLMLNPTVGIMSSLKEPDAITFTNVVFPACYRMTNHLNCVSSFNISVYILIMEEYTLQLYSNPIYVYLKSN